MERVMKHTKGPWNQCCAETTPHFVFADEDQAICSLRCNDPVNSDYNHMEGVVTNEERIANAKLIAAAPDLLEACIWAVDQFKILADKGLYPEHLLTENGGNGVMPLVNAIKKATE